MRRLLTSHPRLRLVLMSATAHNGLYRDYFARTLGDAEVSAPLHVGGRRFPIDVSYLDELAALPGLPQRLQRSALKLAERCEAVDGAALAEGSAEVPAALLGQQLEMALWLTRLHVSQSEGSLAGGGAAVLIFVPGMDSLEELAEHLQVGAQPAPLRPFPPALAPFSPPLARSSTACRTSRATSSCRSTRASSSRRSCSPSRRASPT